MTPLLPVVVDMGTAVAGPEADRIAVRARALREAEGLLSGYAAGELDEDPNDGLVYDLLGDIKRVVVEAGRDWMHSEEIVTGLAGLRPGHYRGWPAEVLAKNLTPLGVVTKPLYRTGSGGVRTNRRASS